MICCLPPQSTLLTLHTLTLRKAPRGGRVREMVGIVLESALHLPPSLMLHHTMPPWPNGQGLTTDQEIGVLRLLVALRFGVLRPTAGRVLCVLCILDLRLTSNNKQILTSNKLPLDTFF